MIDEELMHYGVKGMRWGVRKERSGTPSKRGRDEQAIARLEKQRQDANVKIRRTEKKLNAVDDKDFAKMKSGKISRAEYDKRVKKLDNTFQSNLDEYTEVLRSIRREKRVASNNTRGEMIVKTLFASGPFTNAANEYLINNPPEKSWRRAVAKIYTGDPREWADIVRGDYR